MAIKQIQQKIIQIQKTLSFKSKKPTLECVIHKEKMYFDKENNALLACKKVERMKHPIDTPNLLITKQVSLKHGEYTGSPKVNHNHSDSYQELMLKSRYQVQSVSELQFQTNISYKYYHGTEDPKQTDKSGISKNKFLSPKLSKSRLFDKNTKILYQLASKLMPVSISEDLICYRKIKVNTHSIKYHQSNKVSNNELLKQVTINIEDQSTHCKENLLCKMPLQTLSIRKIDKTKTTFCKPPEIYSSSVPTSHSSESYSSIDDSSSPSTNKPCENIHQLLHPHWRRVPHKSYFGWTNKHESVFNELQTKVRENKIPSACYRNIEEYLEETRRIRKNTNVKFLKGPIVVNVDDILDLIHKNHALSLKSSERKHPQLDSYDSDSDEIDCYKKT